MRTTFLSVAYKIGEVDRKEYVDLEDQAAGVSLLKWAKGYILCTMSNIR